MNWGFIGLLAVFGIFIVLLVINPNLSCFGRRIKSPFYPMLRQGKLKRREAQVRTTGQKTAAGGQGQAAGDRAQDKPIEDYGFKLD